MADSIARRRFLTGSAAAGAGLAGSTLGAPVATAEAPGESSVRIFVNNVGYEPRGVKRAVVSAPRRPELTGFEVVDVETGGTVHRGVPEYSGEVDGWNGWEFWTLDLSPVERAGEYALVVSGGQGRKCGRSHPFRVEDNVLERYTLSHVVDYFQGQRCSGQFDKADHTLPAGEEGRGEFDAHGGWYAATGDRGKHFTQLSHTTYFNTSSLPLAAWSLFAAHRNLVQRDNDNFTELETRLLDEALFGADYLTRVKMADGTFYSSVNQPGPPDVPADRYLEKARTGDGSAVRQVAHREGGGLAIAALAAASTCAVFGEYDQSEHLAAAEDAFEYLEANNTELTNDGRENILDDCNALLAAAELYNATQLEKYRKTADTRANNLRSRLVSWSGYAHYWSADDHDRPFFHPSDAGLPVIALLVHLDATETANRASTVETVRKSLEFEMSVTREVNNPFGYARELVQDEHGNRYSGFFFPHTVTPRDTDQWWQGENARIASLAGAARWAAKHFSETPEFAARLRSYADDQLNWILGVNPYEVCMLDGSGHNNPQYMWKDSWQFLPSAGGIVNGITGRHDDGSGIAWNRGYAVTGEDTDWRWTEQWIPHASWYVFAASLGNV